MTARTLAWTGFIAIAAFVLMAASRLTLLDPVENLTLNVTSPIQSALRNGTRPIADWVNNLTDASGLSRENKGLRAENERLTNELARAREDAVQQQNARDLDAVRSQFPNDTFLAASVVSRDSSNVRSVVAIDLGRSDGVREGMIVVTEGRSLVGSVSKVFDNYAWVTLITDPKSAVSAIVQESRAEGVVAGNYGGALNMEFVGQGAAVKQGDFVLTFGRRRRLSAGHRHRPRVDGAKGGPGPVPERARQPPGEPVEPRPHARADQLRAEAIGEAVTGAAA